MTEREFETRFPLDDEDACRTYLKARRWPDGVHCPRCGNPKVYDLKSRQWHWQCTQCAPGGSEGYRFSLLVGTIFENTNKPLRDWFKVTHLMLTSKKGISALQIQRQMGFGSYKTAHGMCHKIRTALMEPETKLGGIVEIDETYVGGKNKNRHWDKRQHDKDEKEIVIGAVKRKGNVIARVVENVKRDTIETFVKETLSNRVSLLCTDDYRSYNRLHYRYPHGVVNHAKGEYAKHTVIGTIHTNTIEGFWSILKRGIVGTFHKVSAKYLPLYVAEFQFRYNNRMNADIFGTAIAGC
jgi:IS1 family transposase/transposase-like protein